MGRITVIANQKGGVGKTSTAHALATGLTAKGYKVLAVDCDAQRNLSETMRASEDMPGVYEVLKGSATAREAIQGTQQGFIIGADLALAVADIEFNSVMGREYILAEALKPLRADFDFIILDSPPALGLMTINALTAADDVIIPLGADSYSLRGLLQLDETIKTIRKRCNPALNIAGLLITRFAGRSILSQELKEAISQKAAQIGAPVFDTVIREGIAVKEAQTRNESIFSTKSNAAADYAELCNEYIAKGGRVNE